MADGPTTVRRDRWGRAAGPAGHGPGPAHAGGHPATRRHSHRSPWGGAAEGGDTDGAGDGGRGHAATARGSPRDGARTRARDRKRWHGFIEGSPRAHGMGHVAATAGTRARPLRNPHRRRIPLRANVKPVHHGRAGPAGPSRAAVPAGSRLHTGHGTEPPGAIMAGRRRARSHRERRTRKTHHHRTARLQNRFHTAMRGRQTTASGPATNAAGACRSGSRSSRGRKRRFIDPS